MTTRPASHAGLWYTASPSGLSNDLDKWLADVGRQKMKESKSRTKLADEGEMVEGEADESKLKGNDVDKSALEDEVDKHEAKENQADKIETNTYPIPGARIIIAPHAGYEHSGPTAAWAYKSLDLSNAKHIFLLGPAHVDRLSGCALSAHSYYATPFGNLKLDRDIIEELRSTKKFTIWNKETEKDEHSLEMHLPYIYKMLSKQFKSKDEFPTLIPILVAATSAASERMYGKILAPYLAKPTSVFVVSSDFCHWGLRFAYTNYLPKNGGLMTLDLKSPYPTNQPIYESIGLLDKLAMEAIEGGKHQDFLNNLRETGNTVCGRHPIGVAMAALEILEQEGMISSPDKGRFKFIQYKRNENVEDIYGSSVSYASAVAVL